MEKNNLYLTTGEFAKLCHTSKHTLFHYCDIGLFLPAYTDENGYRYYHVLQYDSFLTISQLAKIGMPLSEIKSYMTKRSPQRMAELFQQQEQRIHSQISELEQIAQRIHSQKDNLLQVLNCSETYFLEQQNCRTLLCSELISQPDDYTMTTAISNLIHLASGKTSAGTLGMLCNRNDAVSTENYPFRFYLDVLPAVQQSCFIKPAGAYLSTYHQGGYETLEHSYQSLLSHAEERNIDLDQWIYAETIVGDWAVSQSQDYIIKISAKVTGEGI